jgi:hypothetical protein
VTTESLFPSLVAEAKTRITAGQRRAAKHVLDRRTEYPTLDALAEALALAVVTAEDDADRRVIVLRSTAGLFVYGPYASRDTALKVAESGALGLGGDAAIVPLVRAPRSPLTKEQTAPPKRKAAA